MRNTRQAAIPEGVKNTDPGFFLIEDAGKTDEGPKFCDLSHPQAFSQLISAASA
jgi:hypothetical protein